MNAKPVIQTRCSVNQAAQTVVPRKDTWFSEDHILFHPDPFISAYLLPGVHFVRKLGRMKGQ